MERMDTSLDKFYRFVYQTIKEVIPEKVLGKMVVSIVKALSYLKKEVIIEQHFKFKLLNVEM